MLQGLMRVTMFFFVKCFFFFQIITQSGGSVPKTNTNLKFKNRKALIVVIDNDEAIKDSAKPCENRDIRKYIEKLNKNNVEPIVIYMDSNKHAWQIDYFNCFASINKHNMFWFDSERSHLTKHETNDIKNILCQNDQKQGYKIDFYFFYLFFSFLFVCLFVCWLYMCVNLCVLGVLLCGV